VTSTSLVTIGVSVPVTIGIRVFTIHWRNPCATLLLAFGGHKRISESLDTSQTIEELSNRQVDDILYRLLTCEKGGHAQLEALTV
jgi:hypothetical protein